MKLKLLLWPLGIFFTGVVVAFAANMLLTVDLEDVLYHKKYVHAGKLNEPWPGKAYAYYKPTRQFEKQPLCSKELDGVTVLQLPETMKAHNKVGLQFSQALAFVMASIGLSAEDAFEVRAVSLTLPLEKQYMAAGRAPYQEYCIQDVVDKASDPDYLVLMVENAYFAENEGTGLPEGKMVAFNPKPITFEHCDPAVSSQECDFELVSVDYFDARWVTRVKYVLALISFT